MARKAKPIKDICHVSLSSSIAEGGKFHLVRAITPDATYRGLYSVETNEVNWAPPGLPEEWKETVAEAIKALLP